MYRINYLLGCVFLLCLTALPIQAQDVSIVAIAHNLNNPRGLTVTPDGHLILVEAGTGRDRPEAVEGSGQISKLVDLNADGDYDDDGERTTILIGMPSYNSLPLFHTYHDEVFGLSDVILLADGRLFFTRDDPYFMKARNQDEEDGLYNGATGVFELLEPEPEMFVQRPATLNSIVFNPQNQRFYVVESGYNQLTSISMEGEAEVAAPFAPLAHGQQAVPSGVAYDPKTGNILVALFSGFVHNYMGEDLSFMPGDAKIVRFDPTTGKFRDEITGLTTAIDVAADELGNLFVVEMTTQWATAHMPIKFDLYSPDSVPDPGGYVRFSGRVSMYPAGDSAPIILADGLDTPTNITYANKRLYVSTGLGTPGRRVLTPDGIQEIEGVLYMISGF